MRTLANLRQTLRPDVYHGKTVDPPFFEGWYFKLVDSQLQRRFAVIPGVFKSVDPADSHAFVQVLDGESGASTYHQYPFSQFQAAEDRFQIDIGPNHFSADQIQLDITDPQRPVQGTLQFETLTPWPVHLASPGIMGPFAWVPRMECYHGVVSLDHAIRGSLCVAGEAIQFDGGRGYIEKDWGRSFPSAYIWFQTNHFPTPRTSLTASIAIIPWLQTSFPGFIIGLWWDERLYRFATYTGARVEKLVFDDETVNWSIRSGSLRLELAAWRAEGGLLHAPTVTGMRGRISETIHAKIQVRLSQKRSGRWQILFEEEGRAAGLEAAGNLAALRH